MDLFTFGLNFNAHNYIVEAIRSNYGSLIYRDELSEDAKAKYFTKHIDPTTVTGQNGGAHFGFLESLAERAKKSESQKFYVSSSPSIADVQLYDVFDVVSLLITSLLLFY